MLETDGCKEYWNGCYALHAPIQVCVHEPPLAVCGMLQYEDLEITLTKSPQPKPENDNLIFGHHFSDHMLTVDWSAQDGWGKPLIHPVEEMKIHPAAKALHYAVEVRMST